MTWTNWHKAEGGHADAPNNKGGHQNCVVVTWHALHGGWQGSWDDLQCDLALDGQGKCQVQIEGNKLQLLIFGGLESQTLPNPSIFH